MFKAIGRYFRALGYLITGNVDSARKALNANPTVVGATFDRIISEKKQRIQQYKDAVGAMIAQEEKKKSELTRQSEEIVKLTKLRDGAAAMARRLVEKHAGNAEAVKSDPEYQKCQAAFQDFSSTLAEKQSRVAELESDIVEIADTVTGHKIQLQGLLRDLEKLKQEKHETVADIITAKEEREIADIITGISNDRTGEELEELRQMRAEAKGTARISREMAGVDARRQEEEFLQYAEQAAADSEFDRLIGLTKEEPSAAAKPDQEKTKLPEG